MAVHDRFTAHDGAFLVVDLQERLLAPIRWRNLVVANALRLARAAQILGVHSWGSEQNPDRLGTTIPEMAEIIPFRPAKMEFRAAVTVPLLERMHGHRPMHVTVAGIEAHICVAQTVLELLSQGYRVQVPADAVASRYTQDWSIALRRMEAAGAVITTTEAVLFEWLETAHHPHFKAISALVKDFVHPEKAPVAPRTIHGPAMIDPGGRHETLADGGAPHLPGMVLSHPTPPPDPNHPG